MSAGRGSSSEDRLALLLSRTLAETVDNSAALLTILDLQARILAHLEGGDQDVITDEISMLLKKRRRELLRELDAWTDSIERSASDRERH